MKSYLLLCFIITISSFISAQNYLPTFGNPTSEWYIVHVFQCDGYFTIIMKETSEMVEKDSMQYYKFSPSITYDNFHTDPLLLREDTMLGKIYRYDTLLSTEKLIIDYSLEIGDTFPLYNHWDGVYYTSNVIEVDTIDGRKIITFDLGNQSCLEGYGGPIQFIEGIGSNTAFDHNGFWLTCKHENGQLAYPPDFQGNCFLETSTHLISNQLHLTCIPNPLNTDGVITFTNPNQEVFTFELLDIQGTILDSKETRADNILFKTHQYPSGLYFIKIYSSIKQGILKIVRN